MRVKCALIAKRHFYGGCYFRKGLDISFRKAEIGAVYNYGLIQHHKIGQKKVIVENITLVKKTRFGFCFYFCYFVVVPAVLIRYDNPADKRL